MRWAAILAVAVLLTGCTALSSISESVKENREGIRRVIDGVASVGDKIKEADKDGDGKLTLGELLGALGLGGAGLAGLGIAARGKKDNRIWDAVNELRRGSSSSSAPPA